VIASVDRGDLSASFLSDVGYLIVSTLWGNIYQRRFVAFGASSVDQDLLFFLLLAGRSSTSVSYHQGPLTVVFQ
jgi:hypothetical protein